jgi:hypothetical protein
LQIPKKKGFATNDKNLHSDGDFFATRLLAQQLIAVTWIGGIQNGAWFTCRLHLLPSGVDDGERVAREVVFRPCAGVAQVAVR